LRSQQPHHDVVYLGSIDDTLHGGAGDDLYDVTAPSYVQEALIYVPEVVEQANQGIDTVQLDRDFFRTGGIWSYALSANVENLSIDGSGATGRPVIVSGNGLDNTMVGSSGGEDLNGKDGNDTLTGLGGNDGLYGGNGQDTLIGQGANTVMQGGAGSDVYRLTGRDAIGAYDAVLEWANQGTDRLESDAVNVILIDDIENYAQLGPKGVTMNANKFANVIDGGQGAQDFIYAGAGDDTIRGRGGYDQVWGGDGSDKIHGGSLTDWLQGEGGHDWLFAGGGDDDLDGGIGNDTLFAGLGDDRAQAGSGNDTVQGNNGVDALSGGAGDDRLYGGDDDDSVSGDDGHDSLVGGTGNDQLNGGLGDDSLLGEAGRDSLAGHDGSDILQGGADWDKLQGGSGNDHLYGGGEMDELLGGAGRDSLTGGAGADLFQFASTADSRALGGWDVIVDFAKGEDRIDLYTVDAVHGFWGNQVFTFVGAAAAFSGKAGEIFQRTVGGNTMLYMDTNGDKVADMNIELMGLVTLSVDHFYL
jgi:Ca2+-binding RTX toxin-like protein